MSATRIAAFSGLPNPSHRRIPPSDLTPSGRLRHPKPTDGLLGLRYPQSSQPHHGRKMDVFADVGGSGVEPASSGPLDLWKNQWLLGLVTTIFVPFLTRKWGPLLKLTKEAESKMEMAEGVVEAVEKAAEDVEKAAEAIADKIPAAGVLVDGVEKAAEAIAEGAEIVDDAIKRAEKLVEDVESKIEAAVGSEDDDAAAAAASGGEGKKEVKPEDDKSAKNEVKPEGEKSAAGSAGDGKKEVKPGGASDQTVVESLKETSME